MAASTEIPLSPCTYDVFLSFRGKDTRFHFTDHLNTALIQAGFHTFRDDDELPRGENIETKLQKAIRESKISVIVFSKDYASSAWCLDELVKIMKKMSGGGHTVLPIFYDVPPSHVRYQNGSFASAFSKHMEQSWTETDKIKNNQWRDALKDAADLAGMELNNRYESHFIQEVVREIRNKLHPGKLDLTPHLVGTNLSVAKINSWLQDEAHDASMAVIYGMGGVGKTTIAKIVYNENFERFERSSFVANVRDVSKQPDGLNRLQNQLLSDILKGKIHTDVGIGKIQNAICCKKVLIIFDDVDESDQLDALIGKQKLQLYRGSKIILTARCNKGLPRANQVIVKFEIKGLNDEDSLQLFSLHAFGQHHPIDNDRYLKCSMEAVDRCEGLPVALEVFGSSLFDRNIDFWEDALQKLKNFPDSKIHEILKISYDSLKDDHNQDLFLDIACFFVGMEKNYVSKILNGCGFSTVVGIQNLVDRCLLSVCRDNKLSMHQLLIEMGREIVRQESRKDPGRRSRLWNRKDACTVLQDKTGTKEIRGLVLDLYRLVESSYGSTNTDLS